MTWEEENGWSLPARRAAETAAVGDPVYTGLGVVPDADDVSA